MSARFHSIARVQEHAYEVTFELDGRQRSMLCKVIDADGVRVVRPEPDLMVSLGISPRLVAAAVLAFDALVSS